MSAHNDIAAPAGPEREAAFQEALDVLADRRDEFNEQGFVPKDYIALLKKAGIYRASTPQRFGGDALPPSEFMRLIERISAVDPATGWVASFGSSLVYLAALPLETQAEIFADGPDVTYAGGLFPMQEGTPEEGGVRCTGTWQFASGCKGADIIGVGLAGGPESQGRPLTALVRPEQAEIVDNWDVSGMQATGSHNIRLDNVLVPQDWTFIRGGTPLIDEPLYRYPALAYAAQVLAVTTLGAARGALDYTLGVSAGKTSITGGSKKGQRGSYKSGLALAEAQLRSARAYFYEVTDEAFALAESGDEIPTELVAAIRLAATHAAHVGRDVTLTAFDLAGTGAIYSKHPMQRFLRDALVPAQHAFLQSATYEAAGAVLLGLDPELPSFP